MQEIRFWKYQGAGNDFVVLDNRKGNFSKLTSKEIELLCHRRFGIGADGLMMLSEGKASSEADKAPSRFRMDFFNSDGETGSMCGNGGRCICAFALFAGLVKRGETFSFEAPDGLHKACVLGEENDTDTVALHMRDVERYIFDEERHIYLIDTGSPHYIRFVEKCGEIDVVKEGKRIRYSEEFPAGINVDFVEILKGGGNDLRVRTYERGVEDETYACGTGVTAAALAFALEKAGNSAPETHHDVKIETRGGLLHVSFDLLLPAKAATPSLDKAALQDADSRTPNRSVFHHILLSGPACKVFEGVYRG